MTNKIITISRQFGSGGRSVGKEVAEKLGIKCYDSEILTQIAQKSGFTEDYIKEQGEYTNSTGIFATLGSVDFYGKSNQLTIWSEQCKIIKQIASEGDCVIVGRCADYILKDNADVNLLKTFIYADMDYRAKRIVEQYGESDINPKKRLKDKDKRRAAYYEIYTDQKFGDPLNYDMCLNTATLGLDRVVELIVEEYNRR